MQSLTKRQPGGNRPQQGSSAFFEELLDNLYDGVYYVDLDRRITYWNKAAETITGYSRQEILGKKCSDNILRHVDERGTCLCLNTCPLAHTIADGQPRQISVYLHHKEGHRLPVLVRVSPLRNGRGRILGAVEIFSDNSEMVAALQRLQELQHLAYLDTLTSIANRRYLEVFLEARFNELSRFGWVFGLLLADIDHFKEVNDRYGHQAGDLMLQVVARTMAKNCRSFDLVGRWGGDEFMGIFSHLGKLQNLKTMAERLRTLTAKSSIPWRGHSISVTLSLGAAMVRPEDTADSLTQRVDQLLYESKRDGGNCLHLL